VRTPELVCAACGDAWSTHEHRGGPCKARHCVCLGFRWLPPGDPGEDQGYPRPRHGRTAR
jgi:hypothetical protein